MTGSRVPRDSTISPELRKFLDGLARGGTFESLTDKPTTLGGYGITDAEALGLLAGINTQTASYILALSDQGKTIEMNVGSGNTLTVPPNSSVAFPLRTYLNVTQIGAGQTSFVAGSGVTIRSYNGNLKMIGQYGMATLYKRSTDEWVLGGALAP